MDSLTKTIGRWFIAKWQKRLTEDSVFTVAKQMKKQGIPLEIALLTLTRRFA